MQHDHVVVSALETALVSSDTDGVGRQTTFVYDADGRPTLITYPDDTQTQLTYDARGNVTEMRSIPTTGTGANDIVLTADYPDTCTNPVTCNLPEWTRDARGFETEYTYDSTHGGILTVTAPGPTGSAPDGDSPRPQTRYGYTSLYAYYRNSSGAIVAAPTSVTLLTQVSACATTAWTGSACSGGSADETLTTIGYGSNGVANNRLPLTVTTAAGDGAVTQTITSTYDDVGNLLTIDGPLSGTADTVTNRYDAGRQLEGVIGPDPDGGGSLLHRAIRYTYSNVGQVTSIEQGTVTSPSNWASFSALQQQTIAYSSDYQPTHQRIIAGGVTYALTQMSYDAALRPECVAVRMNPGIFAAPPASACTLGTEGANGPDRIVRNTYTNADQVATVTTGYGTGAPITVQTMTYGDNYQLASLTDAGGNVALYEYDTFGRLDRLRFPNATGGGTSTSDYLGYTYDQYGRLTQTRLRDTTTTIDHSYDNLGRVVGNDVSGGTSLDSTMEYDLFSRLTEIAEGGRTLENTYDQLSRLTTAGGPLGNVGYQYDAASRLTRITWPDTYYAQYDYDLTGAVTAIRENGASSGAGVLATYAYDNLGRRTGVTRGNGTSEAAAFDGASRLTSLTQNLSGTGDDVTFAFTYDAAFGIVTRDVTSSNAAYTWSPSGSGTTNYADNGLNQYTSVGGAAQTYDSRGNLTTNSQSYDAYNRLTAASGISSLAYDPAGRLYETTVSGTATRFLYSGAELIGELNSSNALLRRYVPGPGLDEPVVWYEGSGTSDRRWLMRDERSSFIGYATGAGAGADIMAYDEYGAPSSWASQSRFRYAGSMALSQPQLYHMRARAYSPGIGRFMQPDPILHAGGMNLYRYVGNDPLNRVDPSGTFCTSTTTWRPSFISYPEDDVTKTIVEWWPQSDTSCSEWNENWPGGGVGTGFQGGGGGDGGGGDGGNLVCEAGNAAVVGSNFLGQATSYVLIAGIVVAGGALVVGSTPLWAAGTAALATGGILGIASGGALAVGGLLQGVGGGGEEGWSNFRTGVMATGFGVGVGRALSFGNRAAMSFSQRTIADNMSRAATVPGGAIDIVLSHLPSPPTVPCPS